jgi:hypothetical protein
MARSTPFLLVLVGIVIWFAGCKVKDQGSPYPDQPPITTLTVAPLEGDTVNHYIELRWTASDPDGDVVEFKLSIDDHPLVSTTTRDTTIGFPAPNNGEVIEHTFSVSAVDDDGLEGPAASRTFYTINFSPVATFDPDGSVPNNANVGSGFRLTIASADSNPSTMRFGISVDDTVSWIWSADSAFLFANVRLHKYADDSTVVGVDDDGDGSIDEELENRDIHGNRIDDDHDGRFDEDTRGLFPEHVTIVPNDRLLTPGAHAISARVVDAGGALSPIIVRTVTVLADRVPTMDTTVVGTYGGADVYRDGSVYYAHGEETKLVFHATAAQYRGEINAYSFGATKFHIDANQGSDSVIVDSVLAEFAYWVSSPELTFEDVPVGDYSVHMVARDIAGAVSDTASYTLHIVEQHLSSKIVIVDETRDGTGAPGSPNDQQVDDFYAAVFAGLDWTQVDYAQRGALTPYDLKDAGLVMYHADDRADLRLTENTGILSTFLDKGGRLILSGADVLGPFATGSDTLVFSATSFAYSKLHLFGGIRNFPRTGTGFAGVSGYPSCRIDSTKLPTSFHGALERLWTFDPRGETLPVGVLTVSNPDTNALDGLPAAYIYNLSFRVAVFGVPLYYCQQDEVYNLFRNPNNDPAFIGIVEQMLTGLAP